MKQFRSWMVLPFSALVLGGCNEKKVEEVKADAKTAEKKLEAVVDKATGETPAPVVKALTPGERAAFLGVVGHLSKDTESVLSILDGKEIVSRLRSLKTWGFIRAVAKEQGGADPEDGIAENAEQAGKFLGQEFFLATGKGFSTQIANLMKVNQRTTYFQFKALSQGFASAAAKGDLEGGMAATNGSAWIQDALKDIGTQMGLIDSLQLPPVLAGVKAADADSAGMAIQGISSGLDNMTSLGVPVTPLTFKKGGVDFKGYKLAGTAMADMMEKARAEMEQTIAPPDVTKIIEAVKKKNLVVAAGTLGTYVMVYIGDSEDSCPLVDKVEDSLAANDDISFVDASAGKKVVGFIYGDQSLAKSCIAPSLKPIADGIRDGIAGAPGFGETRDLATMLDTVGEKESALLAMAKPATLGGLVVLDGGVKFELYGGTDQGAIDYDSAHKIGVLPSNDDTLMTGSWIANGAYRKTGEEMGEALVETAYALTTRVASFDIKDSEEFDKFKQGLGLFDQKFRSDLLNLWSGVETYNGGVGNESAFVVDLKGTLPPVPLIPQELVDEGKSIRISAIAPVTDRSKLGDGWTKINGSLRNILKTVSEMSGNDIPMPQPTSSEKNDLITWSFPIQFLNDDCTPSVTVSDKWFVATTSKKQSLDVIAAADGPKEERKGAWMELNFAALNKFGTQWVNLIDKYGDKVIKDADKLAEFRAQLPTVRKGLEAAKEWDKIEFYTRKEGGKLRTTLQFKVK
jgi:hypothetical protein